MKRAHVYWLCAIALIVAGVGAVIAMGHPHSAGKSDAVPLAEVKRGDLDVEVHASGELTASKVSVIAAPAIGGDSLQITHLARTGELVKKGDIVVEFDPSEQHYKMEQNHSELLQAEQDITKAKADAAVLVAQDKVALLKAKYGVRRAELDVEKNELLSKIDGDKNNLALQQAKRVLTELEKDVDSHHATSQASIFLAQEKYNKAKLAMDQAQQNLDHMRVTATMDGLVSIQKNMNASGGFYFTGMSVPDYRTGDQVYPGSAIAQVLDPSGMTMTSKVAEVAHDNVKQGEPVEIRFDSLPDSVFHGSVQMVGSMSGGSVFSSDMTRGFDVTIQLRDSDARLRPGLTAQLTFHGARRSSVFYLPRQALFMKDGKRVVYLKHGGTYQQREVHVPAESESRAAVEGLEAGARVALLDPTVPRKQSTGGSSMGGEVAPQ